MVPKGGLEPPRVTSHAPQTCASTSSATSALMTFQTYYYFFAEGDAFAAGDDFAAGDVAGEAAGAEVLAAGCADASGIAAGACCGAAGEGDAAGAGSSAD